MAGSKLLSFFFIALCTFAVIVPTVRAHDDDADEHDRDVQLETEDASKIEVSSFDSVLGNEIKFRAESTSQGLHIEIEFHSEAEQSDEASEGTEGDQGSEGEAEGGNEGSDDSGSGSDDSSGSNDSGSEDSSSSSDGDSHTKRSDGQDSDSNESSDNYKVKFSAIFEQVISYTESNGVAGYQADDTVGSIVDLASVSWNDFSCNSSVDSTGSNVIACTAATSDTVFGIVAHIVDQPTAVSGVDVNPTGIKIDVYFTKPSADYLAVVVGFNSDSEDGSQDGEIEVDDNGEDEGNSESDKQTGSEGSVSFADFGFFSWVTSATINGNSVNVLNSDLNTDSDTMVFSFETAEVGELYWDPVLAVKGTAKLSSDAASMLPSAFLLIVLAFLAL